MNFRLFLREPALLLDLGETLLVALIAFGLPIHGDQQSYLVAALVAAVGLLKAFTTRPFAVAALTDFGRAVLVVLASFGVGLSADQIAVLITLLGTVTTVIIRAQITPTNSPVIGVDGAGGGPVRGEAGVTNIFYALGVALILLAVLLLVLTLLKAFVVSWLALIVLAVLGVFLLIISGHNGRGGVL